MLKDMMPHFDLYQPDSVDAAVSLAALIAMAYVIASEGVEDRA